MKNPKTLSQLLRPTLQPSTQQNLSPTSVNAMPLANQLTACLCLLMTLCC